MTDLSINNNLTNSRNITPPKGVTAQNVSNSTISEQTTKKQEKHLTDTQKLILGLGTAAALSVAAYYIFRGKGSQSSKQLKKAGENISSDAGKKAPDSPKPASPKPDVQKTDAPKPDTPKPEVKTDEEIKPNVKKETVQPTNGTSCTRDLGYLSKIELDDENKEIINLVYSDGKPKTLQGLIEHLQKGKIVTENPLIRAKARTMGYNLFDDELYAQEIIKDMLKKEDGADISAEIAKIRENDSFLAKLICIQNRGTKLVNKFQIQKLIDEPINSNSVIDITKIGEGRVLEMDSTGKRFADEWTQHYQDFFHILKKDNISKNDFENILKISKKIVEEENEYKDLIRELLQKSGWGNIV